jgi:hypothetical protein
MATIYSDPLVRARAGRNLLSHEYLGKLRVAEWEFAALPVGNIGDVLVLGRFRNGERMLHGSMVHTAAGAGTFDIGTYAITATGDLGAVITQALFVSGLAGATTTVEAFPEAAELPAAAGRVLATADVFVCITNIGTAFTTSARFSGYYIVVGD